MTGILFAIAVGILLVGIAATVLLQKRPGKKSAVFSVGNCLMVTVFLALVMLIYPIFASKFGAGAANTIKSILLAVPTSITVFLVDCDYSIFTEFAQTLSPVLGKAYGFVSTVLLFAAPLLTAGFILSFFKNITAHWQLLWSFRSDLYVFSQLNTKALTLAEDIKKQHPDARIIFTGVGESEETSDAQLREKAQELDAICFKKDIVDIWLGTSRKMREVYLFVMSQDESANLEAAVKLQTRYRDYDNFRLYVFSSSVESEMLFSAVSGRMQVRRVNPVHTMLYHFLYEDGATIFESALDIEGEDRSICIVLLGIGRHGTELLRSLPWFCQMDGYRVQIHAFDRDPQALDRFTASCPELMAPERNGTNEKGEAQYRVYIYPGVDVESQQFRDIFHGIDGVTCIFAALGEDSKNIQAAVDLRMLSERKRNHPLVHAIVYDASKKEMLEQVTDYRGHSYDIRFIGSLPFTYSINRIADSALYKDALQRHLKWGVEQDFWTYEFNFRSSIAAAIHLKMREACNMPWVGKSEQELTLEERDALERLEHRRWNAYLRSEGYIYSGSLEKSSRNDLGKLHNNLVPYDMLPDKMKRLDSSVGSK